MPTEKIVEFLVGRFAEDELRRLVLSHYRELTPLLPASPASPVLLAATWVRLLEERGFLDADFFQLLRCKRRRFTARIDALEREIIEEANGGKPKTSVPHDLWAPTTGAPPLGLNEDAADGTVDVAILVALKEEWRVFWTMAGKPQGMRDPDSGRYLYRIEVASSTGITYRCIALCIGDMGPEHAANAASVLLRQRPGILVNIGIAAALHNDLRLCDVVVADQVDGYLATVKAVTAAESNLYEFKFRGSVYRPTHTLVQEVDSLEFAHHELFARWQETCVAELARWPEIVCSRETAGGATTIREAPAIVRAHLASGPVLAASEAFARWVRQRDDLLKALEMEAVGMMLAAHHQGLPTATLVLRGISDFGDSRKSATERSSGGAYRYLAMANASSLFWTLLRGGILPRSEKRSRQAPIRS